jgi:hypothetical protein
VHARRERSEIVDRRFRSATVGEHVTGAVDEEAVAARDRVDRREVRAQRGRVRRERTAEHPPPGDRLERNGDRRDRHTACRRRHDLGDGHTACDRVAEVDVVDRHVPADHLGPGRPDLEEASVLVEQNRGLEPQGLDHEVEVLAGR